MSDPNGVPADMPSPTESAPWDPWDVVIVGAGPAGATAALGALAESPTARVLLLDRADFPRDKCCGDGIAPHAVDVLAELGAADVVDGWTPLDRLDLSCEGQRVEGALARSVWVIPRQVFDARIVERAVAAGAVLVRHRVRNLRRVGDLTVIDEQFTARVVIGADGAHSVVRQVVRGSISAGGRAAGEAGGGARALAIRGYAPTSEHLAGRQLIRYGKRAQPSYAWSFDRGDGLTNVGYGELAGSDLTKDLLLEQLEELIPGVVDTGTGWRAHYLPLSGRGWGREQPDGPVLLAGDAAGLINPMTGEGIYYSVLTGMLAGRAAAAAVREGRPILAAQRYRASVRQRLNTHLHHTWAAAGISRHPVMVRAGIRAAHRDPRVFNDVVELGLGDGRITPRLALGLATSLVRNRPEPSGSSSPAPARPRRHP